EAARHRVPAIYPFRHFAISGGLMSYGNLPADVYRQAAFYVDRILRGAQPADLPVQAPTKFELVINLRTAATLGLTVPLIMQMTADEVMEGTAAPSSRCSAARRGHSRRARSRASACGGSGC